jgi:ATP-dependent helicase/nuclease subunit B
VTKAATELVLVPTERHVEVELARRGARAQVRVFRDFVRDAVACLAPERAIASPHAIRLLTGQALSELREGRLRYPEEPPARIALAHAIDQSIGRLRRAGTMPAHLRALGSAHASLLAEVLDRVDDLLAEADLADPRSACSIVARRLRTAPSDAMTELSAAHAEVKGIVAFEPDDLAVLEALHARLREDSSLVDVGRGSAFAGPGVRITLPRLPMHDDPMGPIADALERRWASLLDAPELDWETTRAPLPTDVITARNTEGEARAVAATVLAALSRGTPPERIALIVPELAETQLEPLRAALGDARIPFCEPRGRPASSSPEGRIVLSLLAVAAGPVTREQVIELLRAPGLHAGIWTDRAEGAEATARATLLAHRLREVPVEIDRTGSLLIEGLTEMIRETREARPHRESEAWMPRSLERLLNHARWLGEGVTSRREIGKRLFFLVDRLKLGRPPVREISAALRAETWSGGGGGLSLRALGEGAAAVRALREATLSLVEAAASVGLADHPSAAADFAAELNLVAQEIGVGLGGGSARAGAVRIARAADVAGLPHDLVVVMGLGERAYGGIEGDEALLDERIRKRLPIPCRPPSARDRETCRRAELSWAIASAQRMVASFCAGDEGDLASPHRLFRWAEDAGARKHHEPASRVARRASAIDPRSAELIGLSAGAPPRPEIAERVEIEQSRLAFFLDPRAPSHAFSGRVHLDSDVAQRRLQASVGGDAPERPVAVTAIERAAGCAFAGFARRVLRIRRTDDLAESADARERGTLVHRALEAAFEGLRDEGHGSDNPARLLAAARARAEQRLGLSGPMAPLRREAMRQAVGDALAVVMRAVDAGEALRFREAERKFGPDTGAPFGALELKGASLSEPSVYVDGQIDRIDVSVDGRRARVVDYKTGRVPSIDEHGKSAFQLPLYAAVVASAYGCQEVEALYVSVRQRGWIEESPKDEEQRRMLGGRRAEVGAAARRVIMGLWQGEVAPRPLKATLCARCDARDICRRPAVAPIEENEPRG